MNSIGHCFHQGFVASLLSLVAVATAGAAPLVSTAADQQSVSLTIYNANLGLVKDQRQVKIPRGASELRFMDVAARIIPASVRIGSTSAAGGFRVLEQNYEYDLLSPQKLMDKFVGKEVRLYEKNPYNEREEQVSAMLLANNESPIYRIGNDITFGHPGRLLFPGVPDDLIAKPTLVWLLENRAEGSQDLEASYLTDGITWRADYVLTLDRDGRKADLSGWVTIDNKSGATYRNARLKLVAGTVNRVSDDAARGRMYKMAMAEAVAAPQFKEEGFFEYHLYTLQRPSTVKDNQTKQISLLSADGIPVRRELVVSGEPAYAAGRQGGEAGVRQKVGVYLEIENRQEHRLGMPLPKGTVRVYQGDADGSLQFAGEDAIDHTPRDEKIRMRLGDAFDVTATRRQTSWKKLASDTYEAGWEIVVRNHKQEEVTVRVEETLTGDWQVLESSPAYRKSDAGTIDFQLSVPKDAEARVTYRVKSRY